MIILPLNTWVRDPRVGTIYIGTRQKEDKYLKGFHLFPSMKSLRAFRSIAGYQKYPVVKVKYRRIRAIGKQGGAYTIVAKEIMRISNNLIV